MAPSESAAPVRLKPFEALAAACGAFALSLQLVLSIGMALEGGRSVAHGLLMYFGYFTILTNLLATLALAAAVRLVPGRQPGFLARPVVVTTITAAIVIVGVTYHLVLRQLWNPAGWMWVADVLLHYVLPLAFAVHWARSIPRRVLRWRDVGACLGYPTAYLAYALLRGAMTGLWPYPFIDVGVLGAARVAWNSVWMFVAFAAVAALLVAFNRRAA
jgi:hypothetical protein